MPCIIKQLTNLYCGGCGTTRMLVSLLHGDIGGAFLQNRAVFLLLPIWLMTAIVFFLCPPLRYYRRRAIASVFFFSLAVLFCFGILRNFPAFSSWQPR